MTTTQHSPATDRRAKAQAALERLTAERGQLLTRRQTAQQEAQWLNDEILRATRAGEPDTLTGLRSDRRSVEESVQDLQRALPGLDRDIQLAEGELHAATVACYAEDWNTIQAEQAHLLRSIEDAIHMIVDAFDQKERLATRQQQLIATVCPGSNHNAVLIRPELIHAITARLQGNRAALSFRMVDWSSWPMTEQGDLLR